jgi:hypothetical protein
MNYVSYPRFYPYESGYYMTKYYNSRSKQYLYKGLYWDNQNKKWIHPQIPIPSGLWFSYSPTSHFYSNLLSKINSKL